MCRRASAFRAPSGRPRSATSPRSSSSPLAGLGLAGRRPLLARRRRRRRAPALRALARLAGRPTPAGHGVLHHERRHQRDVLRSSCSRTCCRVIRARGLGRSFGDEARAPRPRPRRRRGRLPLVTGPNGSGKSTLLALCAGLLAPTRGELEVAVERGDIGYLAHEPLVYRELTALENLDLYGRLYRVPERRERIGMLLERFGLWEARRERVAHVLPRDAAAARALPGAPPRAASSSSSTSRTAALDAEGAALLDAELARARRQPRPSCSPRTTRSGSRRSPPAGAGAGVTLLRATSRALARKDLLLELRSRDTVPAMLLFVVSTLVVFHFALPADASRRRPPTGSSGSALLFTALLGLDARLRRRAGAARAGRARARALRPQRHLAREGDRRRSRSWSLAEVVALPAFALFFEPVELGARGRGRCSPTSGSPASARCSRRWRRPAGRGSCSCRCSSCRS